MKIPEIKIKGKDLSFEASQSGHEKAGSFDTDFDESKSPFATAMRGDKVTPFSALDLSHHHSLLRIFALSGVMPKDSDGFEFLNIIISLDLIHFPMRSFSQTPGKYSASP